ncbi:MAG: hypothetical protein Q7J38_13505 [Gallionella sp.]|nr:hypothetical protein [Gallionella sp.]
MNAQALSPALANLKLASLNAEAESIKSSDFYAWLDNSGFLCVLFFACSQATWAEGERVYQYRADGSREWSANYYELKGDAWIPYRPDGSRDWKENSVRVEGGNQVQYRPDGTREWNAPVLQLKK